MLEFIKNYLLRDKPVVESKVEAPKPPRNVHVWYPDAVRAETYEDVVDIFLFDNHNMVRLTDKYNHQHYINLDKVSRFVVVEQD